MDFFTASCVYARLRRHRLVASAAPVRDWDERRAGHCWDRWSWGEKVKENKNKGEGLCEAEMEDIGLSIFLLPYRSSRRQKTDLFDFEFQLFLLSFHCSSKCLFPNPSLFFFLGYENYFSSYGWRKDSIEVYPDTLLISIRFRYSHE